MAAVSVSTTPVTLDAGTAAELLIRNTGSFRALLTNPAGYLRTGETLRVQPGGAPVTATSVGGTTLDVTIIGPPFLPAAPGGQGEQGPPGWIWRGAYSGATTYAARDAVRSPEGRAFMALVGTTGIAPPTTAVDSATWTLIADKGAAGIGAAGALAPSDLAFKSWVCDPALLAPGTRTTPVTGQMTGSLVSLPADTVTGATFFVGVAGAAVTNCYAALIDAATGNRLAVTADISTTVQSTGLKRVAFAAPVAVSGGPAYVVFLVGSATTVPQVTRLPNTDSAFSNARGPASPTGRIRCGQITVASGLTAIPATNDMSGSSAQNTGLWAAID